MVPGRNSVTTTLVRFNSFVPVNEDFRVDYILTHTAPRDVAAAMGYGELSDDEVELRQYLQRVADKTEFQKWYFGHFHEDAEVEEVFVCLYDEVVEL